jgi:hypothetical protein
MFFAVKYAISIIPAILMIMKIERKIYNLKDENHLYFNVSATVL